jgi:hypothetical protein
MKVFLSHSSNDKDFVEQIAKLLREKVQIPWLDKWEMGVGDFARTKLVQAVGECDCYILFWSTAAKHSTWVNFEIETVLKFPSKHCICVQLEDIEPPQWISERIWLEWFNWRDTTTLEPMGNKLIRAIDGKPSEDPPQSSLIIDLPSVTNAFEFKRIIEDKPYNYSTTSDIREQSRHHQSRHLITDMALELIIDLWDQNAVDIMGICAIILSTNFEEWKPKTNILEKLECLCFADLSERDYSRIGVVEPLAFVLATKRHPKVHTSFLHTIIMDDSWRKKDSERAGHYYDSINTMVTSFDRHLKDPLRSGFLRANDIGRLISLIIDHKRSEPGILRLLRKSILELGSTRQDPLAMNTIKLIKNYGIDYD